MSNLLLMENRGSMERFDPLTPGTVTALSGGSLTYSGLCELLAQHGLSIKHVVHDPGRRIEHTFYADYERGAYGCLAPLTQAHFDGDGRADLRRLENLTREGNSYLLAGDLEYYYRLTVPVPLLLYDFQRRVRSIRPEYVFDLWYKVYSRITYPNGMWTADLLEYVFSQAPEMEKPETGANGMVTIYRGVGELSQPAESAISWSTHPGSALWFANHTARGTHMVMAEVAPEDIVAYFPSFKTENEVLVRPNTVRNIRYEDMFPATQAVFNQLLTLRLLAEFQCYGRQVAKFGYTKEGLFGFHGINHILRVLLLSLVYYYSGGDDLSESDKNILIYFSLLHDVGRTNEYADDNHGDASVALIAAKGYRVASLRLGKQDRRIADLIIRHHCREDDVGIEAIQSHPLLTRKDKERAVKLYRICKDMDGLDRVRFNGLDYRMLRTSFARKLPLVAGALLKEDLPAVLNAEADGQGA